MKDPGGGGWRGVGRFDCSNFRCEGNWKNVPLLRSVLINQENKKPLRKSDALALTALAALALSERIWPDVCFLPTDGESARSVSLKKISETFSLSPGLELGLCPPSPVTPKPV